MYAINTFKNRSVVRDYVAKVGVSRKDKKGKGGLDLTSRQGFFFSSVGSPLALLAFSSLLLRL